MKLFGNKPEEKAMSSLIHDTNEAFFNIEMQIKGMDEWLKENRDDIKGSEMWTRVEYIRSSSENLKKAIDTYYNRFSKDFIEDEILQNRTPKLSSVEALKKEIQWLRNRYDTIKPRMTRLSNHYKQKCLELEKALSKTR